MRASGFWLGVWSFSENQNCLSPIWQREVWPWGAQSGQGAPALPLPYVRRAPCAPRPRDQPSCRVSRALAPAQSRCSKDDRAGRAVSNSGDLRLRETPGQLAFSKAHSVLWFVSTLDLIVENGEEGYDICRKQYLCLSPEV